VVAFDRLKAPLADDVVVGATDRSVASSLGLVLLSKRERDRRVMREASPSLEMREVSLKFGEGPSPKVLSSWRKEAGHSDGLSKDMERLDSLERPEFVVSLLLGKM